MIAQTSFKSKIHTLSPIIIFCIFLFGYIVSFWGNVDRELSNQLILSVSVLFLIYPIQEYNINIDKIVKVSGAIMALYTLLLFLLIVVYSGGPLSSFAYSILNDFGAGGQGKRAFTDEASVSFHLGAIPFLYLPFCLFFHSFLNGKRSINILGMLILIPAIILSISRGLWIVCIIGIFLIFFLHLKRIKRIVLISITLPFLLFIIGYLIENTNAFSLKEESNNVKIGHVISFVENLNPINFLIGDGLAGYYYSKGSQIMKSNTEVTPIDMLRYFGFILTPILYAVILFPTQRLTRYKGTNYSFVIIFILYLINSFTNPIMFNSYGLLVVLWYWAKILERDKNYCSYTVIKIN